VHVAEVIEPRSLVLEVEPRAKKRVPVVAPVVGVFAPGVGLARDPSPDPDSVDVSGARRLLATVDVVRTEAIDVSGLKERAVFEVRLEDRGLALDLEPRQVVVTVDVERLVERRFDGIPIEVLHERTVQRAVADPGSGSVLVVGPQTAVDGLRAEDVRLVIEARNLAPGNHEAPAQAKLPGGLSAASLEPKVFRITLE
jgi:YbbR domain-containing protein